MTAAIDEAYAMIHATCQNIILLELMMVTAKGYGALREEAVRGDML